ncbi:unnamed protein product [Durusdinium trenchii]|uniref:Uncharacterized protein n=2 Tax=Durusdinium trenchii TaxID=1381693 RepID=A0ABP0HS65_9DINO
MELGVQVTLVAQQIAKAIHTIERKEIRVSNARRNWPNEVPDILVCTPRAAAQGLAPCQSQDEMARKQALKRIKDVELVVFDEADLLMDFGSQSDDVQAQRETDSGKSKNISIYLFIYLSTYLPS